ncbi:VOC family protein [Furfurilactobacillus siliginis]|uniref:Glyoxalase n=1 Tax=Furfurilactobacillus siliginis TaxID=348151 RepID=A0A0R2L0R0_9LACO|nr:VOC family protein [Furfurilactobacillus siliginis]KRN95371.1 lactoylglutathione lyase [Furfurilactobacillus siliginis]GEK28150.1 glyoxalase [Furfurilactobacillus siliginis]
MFAPHHISLLTGNATKNAQFYIQVLGLRLVKNSVNQENVHIRHLYYGNNLGEPGSVVTFFVLGLLGQRQDKNHGLIGIKLGIPTGTTDFWADRLRSFGYTPVRVDNGLTVNDPDDTPLRFTETAKRLVGNQVVNNDIPADYQLTGLLGTTVVDVDREASIAFYHDWLGLDLTDHKITLPAENAQLRFADAPDPKHRSRMGRGSVDHIALQVPDRDTLLAYYKKAQALGLDIEMYRDRGWFQSIYVRDAADNRIELATITPGFNLEEPAETMGNQLSLPPHFADQTAAVTKWYADHDVHFDEVARFGGAPMN